MIDLHFDVRLKVRGPFLSRSSHSGRAGIDAPAHVSTQPGKERHAAIPGSEIKGLFREALRELGEVDSGFIARALPADAKRASAREELLGPDPDAEAAPAAALRRGRGLLHFSEEFVSDRAIPQGESVRIKRDKQRRAVLPKHLLVSEPAARPGDETTLTGSIEASVKDDKQADAMETVVAAGLRWITSVGAFRSVGYGAIVDVELNRRVRPRSAAIPSLRGERFRITLTFDAPICISKRRVADNLFESDTELSGAVIKGALASALNVDVGKSPTAPIDDWFTQLRASFAKPSVTGQRPTTPPASMVFGTGGHFCDVAASPMPLLFREPGPSGSPTLIAPRFSVDWKGDELGKIQTAFGIPSLEREMRVRTAIDPKLRRAADAKLFAYDMVRPVAGGKVVEWIGELDFSSITDGVVRRAAINQVARALQLVATGGRHPVGKLPGIGKTKATARVTVEELASGGSVSDFTHSGATNEIVLRLETPALLCPPTNETGSYHDAVAQIWHEISDGAVTLQRFFASQTLVGGYLGRRAAVARGRSAYRAWLLTDAGSVFVLKPTGSMPPKEWSDKLTRWLRSGLDLPSWAKSAGLDDWRVSPHQPEHGFGEISVFDAATLLHKPVQSNWISVDVHDESSTKNASKSAQVGAMA